MSTKALAIQALRSDRSYRIAGEIKQRQRNAQARTNLDNVLRTALHAFGSAKWTKENLDHLRMYLRALLDEMEDYKVFASVDVAVRRNQEMVNVSFDVQVSDYDIERLCVNYRWVSAEC